MLLKPKYVVIAILIVLALIVIFQNTHRTTVHLFFWHKEMPQVVLVLLSLAIGLLLGLLANRLPSGSGGGEKR